MHTWSKRYREESSAHPDTTRPHSPTHTRMAASCWSGTSLKHCLSATHTHQRDVEMIKSAGELRDVVPLLLTLPGFRFATFLRSHTLSPPPLHPPICALQYIMKCSSCWHVGTVCLLGSTPLLPSLAAWNWVTKLHEHVLPSSMFGRHWHHQPCRSGLLQAAGWKAAARSYSHFGLSASPGVMGMLRCFCWHARRCMCVCNMAPETQADPPPPPPRYARWPWVLISLLILVL